MARWALVELKLLCDTNIAKVKLDDVFTMNKQLSDAVQAGALDPSG